MKPAAIANATQRDREAKAEAMLRKLWNPSAQPVTDSVGEMQRLAGSMRHAVDVLGEELEAGALDAVRAVAWLRVLRELRQLLADMERLGLDRRHVELAEGQAGLVVAAFSKVMDVLQLAVDQRETASRVLLAELRAGASDGAVAGRVVASQAAAGHGLLE